MVHAVTHVQNNMGSEVEVTCKDDGKKLVLDEVLFLKITSQLKNHKWFLWD